MLCQCRPNSHDICSVLAHIPGQSCLLQDPLSVLEPLQSSPSPSGLGSLYDMVRDLSPELHVREQLTQSPHVLQLPSTGDMKNRETNMRHNLCSPVISHILIINIG